MKKFTKKYYVGVEGVNDLLHDTEITATLYNQMMSDAENLYANNIENKDDNEEYYIDKRVYTEDFDVYTRTQTVFENGCCRLWLTKKECKPGYEFKH